MTFIRKRHLIAAMLIVHGCADSTNDAHDDTDGAEVTFWRDVAPIYFERCVSCHTVGGIAPFTLDDYPSAKTWAAVSSSAVRAGTMPPWLVVDDGSCGTFHDSRALSEAEIELIAAWSDAGAPEGDPQEGAHLRPPEIGELEGATVLATPDFVPKIEGGPFAEFDEYRCFAVEPGLETPHFVTGYEVRPGNPAIVHHVLGMTVDPNHVTASGETNGEVMARLAAESPGRPGWSCYEGAGEGVEPSALPVAWAPGQGVVEYPDGLGMYVAPEEIVVLQVHYNLADPANVGSSDRTELWLRLESQVERPGVMALPDGFITSLFTEEPASLPPGDPTARFSWEMPVEWLTEGLAVDLYGVLPHMHGFGRKIRLEVLRDEGPLCGVDVPRWDFNWQLLYFYDHPLRLQPSDVLRVTCEYDTTSATRPVTPGWGTGSEMCLMGLFAVPVL